MWIEKTRIELNTSEKKTRLWRGLTALVCWIGLAYLAATSGVWHGLSLDSFFLPAIPGTFLPWLITALLIGTLYFLYRTRRSDNTKTLVCPLCNRIKTNDGVSQCDCGGVFRRVQEMKWVEGFTSKTSRPNRFRLENWPSCIGCHALTCRVRHQLPLKLLHFGSCHSVQPC